MTWLFDCCCFIRVSPKMTWLGMSTYGSSQNQVKFLWVTRRAWILISCKLCVWSSYLPADWLSPLGHLQPCETVSAALRALTVHGWEWQQAPVINVCPFTQHLLNSLIKTCTAFWCCHILHLFMDERRMDTYILKQTFDVYWTTLTAWCLLTILHLQYNVLMGFTVTIACCVCTFLFNHTDTSHLSEYSSMQIELYLCL